MRHAYVTWVCDMFASMYVTHTLTIIFTSPVKKASESSAVVITMVERGVLTSKSMMTHWVSVSLLEQKQWSIVWWHTTPNVWNMNWVNSSPNPGYLKQDCHVGEMSHGKILLGEGGGENENLCRFSACLWYDCIIFYKSVYIGNFYPRNCLRYRSLNYFFILSQSSFSV